MKHKITLFDLMKIDPNISVVLKRNILKKIYPLIRKKFGSIKNFSKLAGFNRHVLDNLLRGRRNIKLKILIKIYKPLNLSLKK